jgi:predicted membrane channel-forming protein YqfA (hemolysin III family)
MKLNNQLRKTVLFSIAVGLIIVLMFIDPIEQDQRYHNFADQRSFFNIPNFFDVMTNILFFFIGLVGLYYSLINKQRFARWSLFVFFFGIFSLCITSGYYHWIPNDNTLFWDRLSLTFVFSSMVVALVLEYLELRFELFILIPAILIGVISIFYWHIFGDLRIYLYVQLAPMISIILFIVLYPEKTKYKRYLIITFTFYLLAKIVEIYDREIFVMNHEMFSGHSLKHIFAALGAATILQMIRKSKNNVE